MLLEEIRRLNALKPVSMSSEEGVSPGYTTLISSSAAVIISLSKGLAIYLPTPINPLRDGKAVDAAAVVKLKSVA